MGELVGSENPFVPIPQRTDLDDSKSRAKKFVAQIESEIAKLKKYPKRCTLINESEFLIQLKSKFLPNKFSINVIVSLFANFSSFNSKKSSVIICSPYAKIFY